MIAALIAAGCDVDARNEDGFTALHHAVRQDDVPAAELLLQHGASLEAKDTNGLTPVALARKLGRQRILPVLQAAETARKHVNADTPAAPVPVAGASPPDPALAPTKDRIVELCRENARLDNEIAAQEDELADAGSGDKPQIAELQKRIDATRRRQHVLQAAMWKLVSELTVARHATGELAGLATLGLVLAERDPEMQERLKHEAQRVNCAGRLKMIGVRLREYAAGHGGQFPDTLTELLPKYIETGTDALRCPACKGVASTGSDYVYVGKAMRSAAADAGEQPLAFDRLENHQGEWINILYGDGHTAGVRISGKRKAFTGKYADLNRFLTGAGGTAETKGTRDGQK